MFCPKCKKDIPQNSIACPECSIVIYKYLSLQNDPKYQAIQARLEQEKLEKIKIQNSIKQEKEKRDLQTKEKNVIKEENTNNSFLSINTVKKFYKNPLVYRNPLVLLILSSLLISLSIIFLLRIMHKYKFRLYFVNNIIYTINSLYRTFEIEGYYLSFLYTVFFIITLFCLSISYLVYKKNNSHHIIGWILILISSIVIIFLNLSIRSKFSLTMYMLSLCLFYHWCKKRNTLFPNPNLILGIVVFFFIISSLISNMLPEFIPIGIIIFLSYPFFLYWIITLIDCATNEDSKGNDKISWILIILFTNMLGAIIYNFVRRPKRILSFEHPSYQLHQKLDD